MTWVLVGLDAVDAWRNAERDPTTRISVLTWLLQFVDGPNFARGIAVPGVENLFVARVPDTAVIVTFYLVVDLEPPAVAIRQIESPSAT